MSYEDESCFMSPDHSEFCGAIHAINQNFYALACGISTIENSPSSVIKGDMIPMSDLFPEVPSWPSGFSVGSGAMSVLFAAEVLDDIPQYIWPEFPDSDSELTRTLQMYLLKMRDIPATCSNAARLRIPTLKITTPKDKQKNRGKKSTIWAKSQGNTIENALHDYRYRPQFGGVRL